VVLATHDAILVDKLQTRVLRLENGKVLRDSFGGYEHEKRAQPRELPHTKHKIFKDAEIPEQAAPAGKKIKITSIGS